MLSQRSFTLVVLMLSVHRLVAQNTETVKSTTSSRRGWRQDTQQGEALTPGEETKVNSERWKNVIGSFLSERQLQQRPTPSYLVVAPTLARPDSVYGVVVGVLGEARGPVSVHATLTHAHGLGQVAQGYDLLSPGEMKAIIMKVSGKSMFKSPPEGEGKK
nr:uncharacterized protein LOC128696734 [Cherax quadricarinatus]